MVSRFSDSSDFSDLFQIFNFAFLFLICCNCLQIFQFCRFSRFVRFVCFAEGFQIFRCVGFFRFVSAFQCFGCFRFVLDFQFFQICSRFLIMLRLSQIFGFFKFVQVSQISRSRRLAPSRNRSIRSVVVRARNNSIHLEMLLCQAATPLKRGASGTLLLQRSTFWRFGTAAPPLTTWTWGIDHSASVNG